MLCCVWCCRHPGLCQFRLALFPWDNARHSHPTANWLCVCHVCVQEEYLSGEEFATVFKMEREAFLKLPQWKRLQLKKSTLLF